MTSAAKPQDEQTDDRLPWLARPVKPPMVYLPVYDEAIDDYILAWSDGGEWQRKTKTGRFVPLTVPATTIIEDFTAIADAADLPGAVWNFASTYGPLYLCEHGELGGYHGVFDEEIDEWLPGIRFCGYTYAEPISRWLFYVWAFRAVESIAVDLYRGTPPDRSDWTLVLDDPPDRYLPGEHNPSKELDLLTGVVNRWVAQTQARPQVRYDSGSRLKVEMGDGTAAARLALTLMFRVLAILNAPTSPLCGECNQQPRTPRSDLCRTCQQERDRRVAKTRAVRAYAKNPEAKRQYQRDYRASRGMVNRPP